MCIYMCVYILCLLNDEKIIYIFKGQTHRQAPRFDYSAPGSRNEYLSQNSRNSSQTNLSSYENTQTNMKETPTRRVHQYNPPRNDNQARQQLRSSSMQNCIDSRNLFEKQIQQHTYDTPVHDSTSTLRPTLASEEVVEEYDGSPRDSISSVDSLENCSSFDNDKSSHKQSTSAVPTLDPKLLSNYTNVSSSNIAIVSPTTRSTTNPTTLFTEPSPEKRPVQTRNDVMVEELEETSTLTAKVEDYTRTDSMQYRNKKKTNETKCTPPIYFSTQQNNSLLNSKNISQVSNQPTYSSYASSIPSVPSNIPHYSASNISQYSASNIPQYSSRKTANAYEIQPSTIPSTKPEFPIPRPPYKQTENKNTHPTHFTTANPKITAAPASVKIENTTPTIIPENSQHQAEKKVVKGILRKNVPNKKNKGVAGSMARDSLDLINTKPEVR